jgi:hypothetical protein
VPTTSRACQGWHGRRPRARQSMHRPVDSHLPWTPSSALSFTTVPGAHQTSTCPRPSPAVAGEETAPRHCRAERCTRPTALGTAQPHHCRQEPLNSATPSPSSLARCNYVAAVDFAGVHGLDPPLYKGSSPARFLHTSSLPSHHSTSSTTSPLRLSTVATQFDHRSP